MPTGCPEARPPSSKPRWFILGLALLFLALSIQYGVKVSANRSALQRWWNQLHHLGDEDIYERYIYPNPPIMALLLEPLTSLPPLVGCLCWFYLKLAMTVLALFWVWRMVEDPGQPFPPWAKALTVLLSLRPVIGDLSHGNVNLFILFLVVASLYAFHHRRDLAAGTLLALAVACKVTPALFIPYFLWKRAWKVLAGCAVGLVLFFVVVPGWFLGGARNLELLASWTNQMVRPYVVAGNVTSDHPNQSLPGLVFRLGTHSPSYLDSRGEPARYDNVIALEPRQAGWVIKGCMAVFAALVVWSCRTPLAVRGGWRPAAEFSLIVLGMLLFSERTWKHHCVTLLLPFAVLSYYLAVCRPGRWLRGYLIGTLAAVLILMAVTGPTGLSPALDASARTAQVYGAYVWANCLLVAALLVLLCRRDPYAVPPVASLPPAAAARPVDMPPSVPLHQLSRAS